MNFERLIVPPHCAVEAAKRDSLVQYWGAGQPVHGNLDAKDLALAPIKQLGQQIQ